MIRNVACLLLFSLSITATLIAEVQVPKIFGDHMVLQQQKPIVIWGWAEPNEEVTITFSGQTTTTAADKDGNWRTQLPAQQANAQPQTLTIQGSNTIEFKDVLIGEVWLCSGQSNMEWAVDRCANAQEEIANGKHPLIRHIKVRRANTAIRRTDIDAEWQVCSPDTVAKFTAAGYYAARRLQQQLDVPVGIVNSTWGGTRIEPWTCLEGLRQVELLSDLSEATHTRTPGTEQHKQAMAAHLQKLDQWMKQANNNLQTNSATAPPPTYPELLSPLGGRGEATSLYNGMIHPLVGLSIRGVFWYQGEANRQDGMMYFEKKKALIQGWRQIWNQGEFSFYFVQIAPFQYGQDNPTQLPEFWEAQNKTQTLPNTGMVVTNDIATLNNIHPPNKQDVGLRLANLALRNDYGRNEIVADSPTMESYTADGNSMRIKFRDTGGGLQSRDGQAVSHFQVIGAGSNGFQPATATIDGDSIVLTSDQVDQPIAFRFAWNKTAAPNLMGKSGLPVAAFRGGQSIDLLDSLTAVADYQLVYEMDLTNLKSKIVYDTDNSKDVKAFDRIGYYLHLQSPQRGTQELFVSMDAFTDDVSKIGIPTNDSGARFQQAVTNMDVFSTTGQVNSGQSIKTGNIEFWPHNYGPRNFARVSNADPAVLDFGDRFVAGSQAAGYGSMQIHDHGRRTTLLAINHWSEGDQADIGIGNSTGQTRDWTFTKNADDYSVKTLRIFVRPKP